MKLYLSLLLSLFFFSAISQTLNDSLKQQLIKDWGRAKVYTQEYLDAMPASKYGFRPVDSMRSFAEQMLHLASANAYFTSVNTGVRSPIFSQNLEKSPTASNRDSVEYYVNTSYDLMINSLKNMDPSKLSEILTQGSGANGRSETRLVWLMKAFEHQTHHRGQCTVYIRLQGIRPPAERLF
ncbi:MAG TPA: DinB family protein [Puia sp.]|nr:DinB family protein [Puia sp.]